MNKCSLIGLAIYTLLLIFFVHKCSSDQCVDRIEKVIVVDTIEVETPKIIYKERVQKLLPEYRYIAIPSGRVISKIDQKLDTIEIRDTLYVPVQLNEYSDTMNLDKGSLIYRHLVYGELFSSEYDFTLFHEYEKNQPIQYRDRLLLNAVLGIEVGEQKQVALGVEAMYGKLGLGYGFGVGYLQDYAFYTHQFNLKYRLN